MTETDIDLVKRGYTMFAAGDLEGIAALFDTEAEVTGAGGLGIADTAPGTHRGPGGFLQAAGEALEAFEDYSVVPEELIPIGDSVLARVLISGTGRGSGMQLETRVIHRWRIRDGKVVLGEVYRSIDEAMEAVERTRSEDAGSQ